MKTAVITLKEYQGAPAKISPEKFNQVLRKYNQSPVDFARILRPAETVEHWMKEFKKANKGGYLLRFTKRAIKTNDYALWWGSATQAADNQNTMNIYDALITGQEPKIVDPDAFLMALRKPRTRAKLLAQSK